MKQPESLFIETPYAMPMEDGNRVELPICVSNSFGAKLAFESSGAKIISCGTKVRVNGEVVESAILKPGDIVKLGAQKLRYDVTATGTKKLAVFYSAANLVDTGKLRNWITEQQKLHEQQKEKETPTDIKPPVITISRQLGSNGTEIAEKLGQKLGWNVWEREIVDKIANDADVHREVVELLDERGISAFEEIVRAIFSSTSTLSWQTYIRHLVGTIISIGQRGETIIVGRGGNFILPEALNIRIIASFDYRIENLMKQHEISQEEAERRIVSSDQDRADFIEKAFNADIDDVALYDLILRMDEFSIDNAIDLLQAVTQIKFPNLEE